MSENEFKLNHGMLACGASVSIKGVTRVAEEIRDDTIQTPIGVAHETERNVTMRVADVKFYERAKTLEGRVRAIINANTTAINALGLHLADAETGAKIRVERDAVMAQVAAFNGEPGNPHRIKAEIFVLPVMLEVDECAVRAVLEDLCTSFDAVEEFLRAGNTKDARIWLRQRKNMAGLLPAVASGVMDGALACVRDACEEITAKKREDKAGVLSPEAIGAGLNLDALQTAKGWATPLPPTGPMREPERDVI